MNVHDRMTPNPVVVHVDTPISECLAMMNRLQLRHLLLETSDGKLAGWLPYDALKIDDDARAAQRAAPVELLAHSEDSISEILDALLARAQDFVVVIDRHRRALGVLTLHDVLKLASEVLVDVRVEALATPDVVRVRPQIAVKEGWELMQSHGFRHLVILAEDGELFGVVSERDIVDAVANGPDRTIEQACPAVPVEWVRKGTLVTDAALRMTDQKITSLPVVDLNGDLVGILTAHDLVGAVAEHLR